MLFDLNHLEETEMSYIRHFNHGMILGMWLFFCFCASLVYCFFPIKFLQDFISERIKTMYHGLMLRWFEDDNFNPLKPKKDAIREKVYKKEYIENIQKGLVKPFGNFRTSYELLVTSLASVIHSTIPQILVHVAAMNVVRLYFSIKIVEKSYEAKQS
jgi:hypothetical protein